MHGGNGVARVDGALEGVGAVHLGDVADLRNIQLGGHARRSVFAAGGGGKEDVAVAASHSQHLRGQVFGQAMLQGRAIGMQHFGDAGHLRGGLRGSGGVVACDEHMHIAAALAGGRDGVQRGGLEGGVVVFGDNEGGHDDSFLLVRSLWLRS